MKITRKTIEKEFKQLKENIRLKFCWYRYETDKTKWTHPANVCVPDCIKKEIDKTANKILKKVFKESKKKIKKPKGMVYGVSRKSSNTDNNSNYPVDNY